VKWGAVEEVPQVSLGYEHTLLDTCENLPPLPEPLSDVVKIVEGSGLCALTDDGAVYCESSIPGQAEWPSLNIYAGRDGVLQGGLAPVPLPQRATDIAFVGGATPCAVLADETVTCWPASLSTGENSLEPRPIAGLSQVRSISPNVGYGMCVVLRTGAVKCGTPQTGLATLPGFESGIAEYLGGDGTEMARTYCALKTTGQLNCVIDGVPVPGLTGTYRDISMNTQYGHYCATTTAGDAYCWGSNLFDGVGNGNGPANVETPVRVLSGVSEVNTSLRGTCARTTGGDLYCWGTTKYTDAPSATPRKVDLGGRTIRALGQPDSWFGASCVIYSDGGTGCWNPSVGNAYTNTNPRPLLALAN